MNGKFCWVLMETKKGLKVGIDIYGKTRYIPGLFVKYERDFAQLLKGNWVRIFKRKTQGIKHK